MNVIGIDFAETVIKVGEMYGSIIICVLGLIAGVSVVTAGVSWIKRALLSDIADEKSGKYQAAGHEGKESYDAFTNRVNLAALETAENTWDKNSAADYPDTPSTVDDYDNPDPMIDKEFQDYLDENRDDFYGDDYDNPDPMTDKEYQDYLAENGEYENLDEETGNWLRERKQGLVEVDKDELDAYLTQLIEDDKNRVYTADEIEEYESYKRENNWYYDAEE